jgi:putative tricarboxylic transport membrane protein
MLLAFVAVTAVLGASRLRGFIALVLGLTIGLVGIDAVSGQARLTFGIPQLGDGIDVVVVAVGIFALGEALWVAAHLRRKATEIIPVGQPFLRKQDWKRSWKPWLRGTAFGFPFGVIPAGGAEIPTFLSYITEKKLTKHPEEFGKGAIEGVAGPEAANNASAAGTMVPMLALGLPTNATSAIMLAALVSFGIQPGPLLLQREGNLVWALIASLFIGNFLLLVLNLPLAPIWAKLLRIPRPYLYAGILFFASMGAYAVNGSNFDLILLLVLGLLGFGMRRFAIPVLPLIVGVILGPRVELQGRRAMQLSSGDPKGLFGSVNVATGQFEVSAIAVVVYLIVVIILLFPVLFWVIKKLLPARAGAAVEHLSEELHQDLDTDADGHPLATSHPTEIKLPEPSQKERR